MQDSFCQVFLAHWKKVNDRLRALLNRLRGDEMEGIDKNLLCEECSCLHLCTQRSFLEKIASAICILSEIQIRSQVTEKLMSEQNLEISEVSELSWRTSNWEKLSLTNDEEVIKLMKAKVYVFSDSVLCVGKMHGLWAGDETGMCVTRQQDVCGLTAL